MKETNTDVLIVGAGPTGLLTAILLSQSGVKVEIIDHEERTAARSYACALHSRSLELMDKLGLIPTLLARGKRVHRVAFYEGPARHAVINLVEAGGRFPFLLVLPQSDLENILEQKLLEDRNTKVRWNHRFDDLVLEEKRVIANVEELGGTAMGYIVPHWETVVQKQSKIHARFIVGADGHNSLVRQRTGIKYEAVGAPRTFVACEFASHDPVGDEVRVVLDDATTNVLWPLPDNAQRWTFQLIHSDPSHDFPRKDRAVSPMEKVLNEKIRAGLQRLAQHRAPWFTAQANEIAWCKQIAFEERLVDRFQKDRCVLAGDSAHQTGPVGMQSMNAGLREAAALAEALQDALREGGGIEALAEYNQRSLVQWRDLLGLTGGLRPRSGTIPWVRARLDKILPCLPGSGEDLAHLADLLDLDFPIGGRASERVSEFSGQS